MKKQYIAPHVELTHMLPAAMLMDISGPKQGQDNADPDKEVGTKEYEPASPTPDVWGEEW